MLTLPPAFPVRRAHSSSAASAPANGVVRPVVLGIAAAHLGAHGAVAGRPEPRGRWSPGAAVPPARAAGGAAPPLPPRWPASPRRRTSPAGAPRDQASRPHRSRSPEWGRSARRDGSASLSSSARSRDHRDAPRRRAGEIEALELRQAGHAVDRRRNHSSSPAQQRFVPRSGQPESSPSTRRRNITRARNCAASLRQGSAPSPAARIAASNAATIAPGAADWAAPRRADQLAEPDWRRASTALSRAFRLRYRGARDHRRKPLELAEHERRGEEIAPRACPRRARRRRDSPRRPADRSAAARRRARCSSGIDEAADVAARCVGIGERQPAARAREACACGRRGRAAAPVAGLLTDCAAGSDRR